MIIPRLPTAVSRFMPRMKSRWPVISFRNLTEAIFEKRMKFKFGSFTCSPNSSSILSRFSISPPNFLCYPRTLILQHQVLIWLQIWSPGKSVAVLMDSGFQIKK